MMLALGLGATDTSLPHTPSQLRAAVSHRVLPLSEAAGKALPTGTQKPPIQSQEDTEL